MAAGRSLERFLADKPAWVRFAVVVPLLAVFVVGMVALALRLSREPVLQGGDRGAHDRGRRAVRAPVPQRHDVLRDVADG